MVNVNSGVGGSKELCCFVHNGDRTVAHLLAAHTTAAVSNDEFSFSYGWVQTKVLAHVQESLTSVHDLRRAPDRRFVEPSCFQEVLEGTISDLRGGGVLLELGRLDYLHQRIHFAHSLIEVIGVSKRRHLSFSTDPQIV